MTSGTRRIAALGLILCAAALPASQTPGPLGPLPARAEEPRESPAQRWSRLSPEERERALAGYRRWKSLSPDDRKLARERWQRFRDLPPDQRRRLSERWQRYQSLTPEERQKLKDRWQRWRSLPPDQRRAVRQKQGKGRRGDQPVRSRP